MKEVIDTIITIVIILLFAAVIIAPAFILIRNMRKK